MVAAAFPTEDTTLKAPVEKILLIIQNLFQLSPGGMNSTCSEPPENRETTLIMQDRDVWTNKSGKAVMRQVEVISLSKKPFNTGQVETNVLYPDAMRFFGVKRTLDLEYNRGLRLD